MTTLAFAKGHAAGNDFVLIADPDGRLDLEPERVRLLCDRRRGIGARGVIRVVRSRALPDGADAPAREPEAEWFMDLWNADGTRAGMSGDGILLCAHFLRAERLAAPAPGAVIAIGTRSGVRDVLVGRGELGEEEYAVDLGAWELRAERLVAAAGLDVARPALGVDLEGPHLVAALAHAGELDALDLALPPEITPPPVGGAEVEFVVPAEPFLEGGVARIRMRAHENTSGAGAAAAALAFRHWGGEGMPNEWRVEVAGGSRGVRMFPSSEGERVSLSGSAEIVYRGEVELS